MVKLKLATFSIDKKLTCMYGCQNWLHCAKIKLFQGQKDNADDKTNWTVQAYIGQSKTGEMNVGHAITFTLTCILTRIHYTHVADIRILDRMPSYYASYVLYAYKVSVPCPITLYINMTLL